MLRRPPLLSTGGAGQQWCRSHDVDDPRWRREQRYEEVHDSVPDFVASATEKLSSTVLFHAFQGEGACSVDELVSGLHEFFLQFLQLLFLVGPVPGVGSSVDREDFLVVVYQRVDSVLAELEGNFIL